MLDIENNNNNIENIEFSAPEPFLQEFHNLILSKVSGHGIRIVDIKQKQWLLIYTFKKGNFFAVIDFYYNKRKQFTRYVPQSQLSTSDELLKKIVSIIGNLQ